MNKRMVVLPIVIVIVFALTSCDADNTRNNIPTKPSESIQKTSDNENDFSKNENYGITDFLYEDKNINVKYPQISGLSDKDKQKKLNDLIKNEVLKAVNYYNDEGVTLDIGYVIKWKGGNLLSVEYFGLRSIKGAAYPNNIFFTTNINISDGNTIKLSDIVNINETLIKKLTEAKYVAWDTELDSASEYVKKDIKNYSLVDVLKNSDSIGGDNTANAFTYFTKDSIVISLGVAHAIGDHAEFEIKYQDIKDNLITENKIWEDLFH